jgi:hypothetical protein
MVTVLRWTKKRNITVQVARACGSGQSNLLPQVLHAGPLSPSPPLVLAVVVAPWSANIGKGRWAGRCIVFSHGESRRLASAGAA